MVACIFGTMARGFLDPIQARLAEVFMLGNGANRVNLLVDICRNELAVRRTPRSKSTKCQAWPMVRMLWATCSRCALMRWCSRRADWAFCSSCSRLAAAGGGQPGPRL